MSEICLITITKNNQADFQQIFLPFAKAHRTEFADIIVVDSSEGQAIADMSKEAGFSYATAKPGRGLQLSQGADQAHTNWLLFLHSDTVLSTGWVEIVDTFLQAEPNEAAVFKLDFNSKGLAARIVAGWANFRTRVFGLPYGDQGLLVSKTLYEKVGGFNPHLPLMEDVDLVQRIGSSNIKLLNARAITSAAKYQKSGWFQRGLRHLQFFLLYKSGKSASQIYQDYYNEKR